MTNKDYTNEELKEKTKEVLNKLNENNEMSSDEVDDEASKIADLLGPALSGIVDTYNKTHKD